VTYDLGRCEFVDGADLLAKAATWPRARTIEELTPDVLRECSAVHGIDFATALIYDRLRRSDRHGADIDLIESGDAREAAPHLAGRGTVAIVPGAFHQDRRRDTGADGDVVRREAQRLGFAVTVAPTVGFGSLEQNADIVANWLQNGHAPPIVLVSLSKGTAEVKVALRRSDAASVFGSVSSWVSFSGMWWGSPLVNWLRQRRFRSLLVRWMLRFKGHDDRVLDQLGYGTHQPLAFDVRMPEDLRVLHVVGFPLRRHLSSRLARRGHRRLSALGPNDGAGILLADVPRLRGTIYPVWGADHYLRPVGTTHEELVRRVLRWHVTNDGCGTSPSTAASQA
jgi:hypothetical protein